MLVREQWSLSILFSFVVMEMGPVATKWGLVIMFIACWEAGISNWKETDSSVLGLKESDERIFSWTAILTATYFKSLHCNKKVMIFGKVCYKSIFYTGKIWLRFLHFNSPFIEIMTSGKKSIFWTSKSHILNFATDFAVPHTPCKVHIIICPCLCKLLKGFNENSFMSVYIASVLNLGSSLFESYHKCAAKMNV